MTTLLQCNAIGDNGARALAVALEQNDSLTNLDLHVRLHALGWDGCALTPPQENYIGQEGIGSLVEALQHNCGLVSLDLGVRLRLCRT